MTVMSGNRTDLSGYHKSRLDHHTCLPISGQQSLKESSVRNKLEQSEINSKF